MGKRPSSQVAGRLLFVVGTLALSALALYPDLRLPELSPSGRHTDFFYHMSGFLLLTLFGLATMGRGFKTVAAMAALAIVLEALQYFVPGRRVFASDLFASLLGVTLAAIVMVSAIQLRRRWSDIAWLR